MTYTNDNPTVQNTIRI